MCGKSSGDTTQTTTTQLPPAMQAAYNSLVGQAQNIYNTTPYTPFSGGVTNPTIDQSTQTLMNAQTAGQPAFNQASSALTAAGTPAYQSVQNYMNPYQQDVTNATLANMNQMDQQQQQGVVGNAILSGAMGGDRVGVAQSQLAGQQDLANNQTLAQLNSQNYSQALGAAQQQQQTQLGVAGAQTGLGSAATTAGVTSGMAGTQAGEDAYNRALAQYQAQQSYPFQETSWLGNIVEGLGSTSGGTSSTTSNANTGSAASSIFGGALGLGSLLLSDRRSKEDIEPIGKTFDGQTMYRFRYKGDPTTRVGLIAQEVEKHHPGAVHTINALKGVDYHEATDAAAKRKHFATGGVVPYSGIQPIGGTQSGAANPDFSGGIIPNVGAMSGGSGPRPSAAPLPASGQPDALSQLSNSLQQKALNGGIDKMKGAISNLNAPAPVPSAANMTTPTSVPDPSAAGAGSGILSALGGFLGFARGGIVRGYDDGGVVGGMLPGTQVFDPDIGWIPADDVAPSPAPPTGVVNPGAPVDAGVIASPATVPTTPDTARTLDAAPAAAPAPAASAAPAVPPQPGGVVPPMPAPQWVPAAPKVNSKAAIGGNYAALDQQQEQQNGLPSGYLDRTGQLESGNDPSAHNNSGAAGRYQFMPATAASVGLQNPYDPVASTEAAARLAAGNQAALTKALGRPPTAAELYLAHQQGAGGAISLLTHPDQPATSLVGEASVVQNGGDPSMTGSQFAGMWINKFNGASPDTTGSIGGSVVAPAAGAAPTAAPASSGILGSIQSALGGSSALSPDMRMALLSAGLGMMAGTSRNPLINIGQGGLAGVQNYVASQDRNRQNALAQSEIATQKGDLGLRGKQVDQAAQQLHQQAQQFAATYGLKSNEQQMQRFQQTVTPAGILVRDLLNPNQAPKLISWADVQAGGAPSSAGTQPAAGQPAATPAPQGGILTPQNAQKGSGTGDAATAAPTGDSGAPPQAPAASPASAPAQPIFQTTAPAQTKLNPMLFSPLGQKVVESQSTDAFKQATTDAASARDANVQLTEMKRDLATLPATGVLAPGNGFNGRLSLASGINTAMQGLGFAPPLPEEQVAAGQDLNKLTTRLGFDLAKSLGSHEAGFIITQAVGAVPGGANSAAGAQRIIGGIQAANQRKIDYNAFLTDWGQKSGGDTTGAADAFNKANPPELYALSAYVPPQAISLLRQHPDMAPQFEQTYGAGTSKYVLGGQ